MADIPDSLQKSYTDILQELLALVPADIDTSEGSIARDLLSPIAMELAIVLVELQEILKRGFIDTSYDEWLDLKASEYGLIRKPSRKATGSVTFKGTEGTIIPSGTDISTVADAVSESIAFVTTSDGVIGSSGEVTIPVEAVEKGAKGNVKAGAIVNLETPIQGVESITNYEATSGGTDIEDDDSLRNRILEKVREYLTGGSIGDYKKWAKEVAGVGKVSVVPSKYGAGTVSIAVLDSNLNVASDGLIEAVEEHIAEFYEYGYEAENFDINGNITIVDLPDDTYSSVKLVSGKITKTISLDDYGIWNLSVRLKVNNISNNAGLVSISVIDTVSGQTVKQSYFSEDESYIVYSASDLTVDFKNYSLDFVYAGNPLRIEIERLSGDTTTELYIDRAVVKSTFAKDTPDCKLPVGVRLYVEKPSIIPISVYANVTLKNGYILEDVKNRFSQKVDEYLKSIIFEDENDVLYVRIGYLLLETDGVKKYTGLLINGDTVDVSIGKQEVAVLQEVNLVE